MNLAVKFIKPRATLWIQESLRLPLLMSGTNNFFKTKLKVCFVALSSVCCSFAIADEGDIDITEISLEQLLEAEFIPARRIAKQISDAPSAVSIVTAQDIDDYGYRTLVDILRSMRGLFITDDFEYSFLGGRGFGIPGDYAGRIMLLIDGNVVNDNVYNQVFFGEDAFLDVALIERVEYVPGPGSTSYGNSAFLGSINITTKKGRDVGGVQVALDFANQGERRQRLTYGERFESGVELLISASHYGDDGLVTQFTELDDWEPLSGDLFTNHAITPLKKNENKRFFLKTGYENWSLELVSADRKVFNNTFYDFLEPADSFNDSFIRDRSLFASINYDWDIGDKLTSSIHLYYGEYRFDSESKSFIDEFTVSTNGQWRGVDAKFVGSWFDHHKLLFGFEYRDDYKQQNDERAESDFFGSFEGGFDTSQKTSSLFIQDEFRINDKLALSSGLRFDHNTKYGDALSPRIALITAPWNGGEVKLSYGQAFRFKNPWEEFIEINDQIRQEKIKTQEVVWQQKLTEQAIFTLALYRNQVDDAISIDFVDMETLGQEVGFEYLTNKGLRLNLSVAHQESKGDFVFSDRLFNSPDWLYKLNFLQSLFDNRLNLGIDAQHVSRRLRFDEEYMPASTVLNLTFSSSRIIPQVRTTLTFSNLLGDAARDVVYSEIPIALPAKERGIRLQLEYNFK